MGEQVETFGPLVQFDPMRLDGLAVSPVYIALVLTMGIAATLFPLLLASWVARRGQSRWYYLWAALSGIVLTFCVQVSLNLFLDMNPRVASVVIQMFATWFPIEKICHWGC